MFALLMAGCEEANVKTTNSGYYINSLGNQMQVIELDSCEYFFYVGGHRMAMAHKGNCKNPIHQK